MKFGGFWSSSMNAALILRRTPLLLRQRKLIQGPKEFGSFKRLRVSPSETLLGSPRQDLVMGHISALAQGSLCSRGQSGAVRTAIRRLNSSPRPKTLRSWKTELLRVHCDTIETKLLSDTTRDTGARADLCRRAKRQNGAIRLEDLVHKGDGRLPRRPTTVNQRREPNRHRDGRRNGATGVVVPSTDPKHELRRVWVAARMFGGLSKSSTRSLEPAGRNLF